VAKKTFDKSASRRYYSGKGSKKFWDRLINASFGPGQDYLYLLGCTLQDLEGRVWQLILEAEKGGKKKYHGK